MTAVGTRPARRVASSLAVAPLGLPRLLAPASAGEGAGLEAHLRRWGKIPASGRADTALSELAAAGLGGRGGANFPAAAKWQSVRHSGRRRPVVVVNGAEGEPASVKDRVLLTTAPHLVLDGAAHAARVLNAARVVVYVPADLAPTVRRAVEERSRSSEDPAPVSVMVAPNTFLAGQESAAVNVVNGRAPRPSFVTLRPVRERGVGGRPTLVQNAETLAHVALIARFGQGWYRSLGIPEHPGSLLLTVTGRWAEPTVVEVPFGASLGETLGLGPRDTEQYWGVLLGGYGGTWLGVERAAHLRLDPTAARAVGASLGAGVVVALSRRQCPVAEVARVTTWMARQGAGQCGPCIFGLAELAQRLHAAAFAPARRGRVVEDLLALCDTVEGRGACRHPDGVARMVRSACDVFASELARHARGGPCEQAAARPLLPVPSTGRGTALSAVGR